MNMETVFFFTFLTFTKDVCVLKMLLVISVMSLYKAFEWMSHRDSPQRSKLLFIVVVIFWYRFDVNHELLHQGFK